MPDESHLSNRLVDGIGEPALAPANCTPSANFGATATATPAAGSTDIGGRIVVLCQGAGPGANPTLAVVFNKPLTNAPKGITVSRGDLVAPAGGYWAITAKSASGFTATFVGTPVAASSYILDYDVRP